MKSSDIHISAISQEIHKASITKIWLKITCQKFHSNFLGTNEFTYGFNHTSVGNRGHVTVRSSTLHPDQAANYWHFHLACRMRLVVALNFREGQDLYPGMTQTRAGAYYHGSPTIWHRVIVWLYEEDVRRHSKLLFVHEYVMALNNFLH